MSDKQRIAESALASIPKVAPDVVEWAEANVVLPSSARAKYFNASITPWLIEPMRRAVDRQTRVIDLMKPVQSGGSVLGEVLVLFWARFWHGFLQYNWSNDKRAKDRWNSRVQQIIEACADLGESLERAGGSNMDINFGALFFRIQGAFVEDNLDSDSIRLQINEEVHAWEPGHLKKASNRSTAIWDYKRVDISNAGLKGDQFDQSCKDGTMQFWEVKCPGCGGFHFMRTQWQDDKPQLGGLRYDAEGARVGFWQYDYNKIRPTIRFQMPCGKVVHNDDMLTRRAMSLGGRYSEPTNAGAELSHRSYTYESVSVDFIDWMTLIQQKHDALRARALGDPEPFIIYKQERECIPYDPEDVPIVRKVELVENTKKNRDGLPEPRFRTFTLDRQQGDKAKGEFPYWWLLIRDTKVFFGQLRSILVYEGRLDTDEQVIATLNEYKCIRHHGCADSGDDTDYVYAFCMRYGINAIKGGQEAWYIHENGARRIYSPERALHQMRNCPPKYDYVEQVVSNRIEMTPDEREPMFWLYSKGGIRERLHWLRNNMQYETPSDVSEDYKNHNDAEERLVRQHSRTGQDVVEWVQRKRRNDLFVCECYAALMLDMSGTIGEADIGEVKTENATK